MTDKATKALIHKYGGAVPRYTSYPTAVQFDDQFTSLDFITCLKSIDPCDPVSLYIHIPFCHSLCHYCGCNTKIVQHTNVISSYVETLCREIEQAGCYLPKGVIVSRIHFGGGSPNYAPNADIEKIIDALRRVFPTIHAAQIDMECDPRLLSDKKVCALSDLGIRRVSLGIQDFDPVVQAAVNRIQPLDHIRDQVGYLRSRDIHDINFDLILGLPEQTLHSVGNTLIETAKMRPSRISVFPYAHVPWMKKHQKLLEKYNFPSPEIRFDMQCKASQILKAEGYVEIGIDHYALPESSLNEAAQSGRIQRNFQGYTDDPATVILGFGLSSISQFKDAYAQNTTDALTYRQSIDQGSPPVHRGYKMDPSDIRAREAIMRIMCYFQLDLADYPGTVVSSVLLSDLEEDGIIFRDKSVLQVTEKGKFFTRVVASCFDPAFQFGSYNKDSHHAKAV
ncbi:oxygen-independent coproporphyrinogen III oxidase [Micavibrio aeruginosavorus]|uniref:Coproporphyrinogen-III oxidase n=1 Tax=Micavibrio aeruginosavorus EPB TaxID=349215 RepID=M4VE57_9BACT|nr:oxygen-independent coproporphyrinogen III oxidase [Micavibrio aeruginosavorus]AGH97657.1 Coproporphyrinogen III oxidase, oxygen-independent [Micavibrio aeruginosavorus EPB]